ncbi:MAG TPA: LytR/AlgR family response regulator transcription factor [Cyclobacteriaceae bacterium]
MNLLILEDESVALKGLEDIILRNYPHVKKLDKAQSLAEAETLLANADPYNFIISDIKLTDGLCFDLYKRISISSPIIFCTAYDHYAIEAFDYNGIAYVLKPVNEKKLIDAIDKVMSNTRGQPAIDQNIANSLKKLFQRTDYRQRFLSKIGNRVIIKHIDEISLFHIENKLVYMNDKGTLRKYPVNFSLDELEKEHLDPSKFYRINRSVIVNLDSLIEINTIRSGRLKLTIHADKKLDLFVSRDRVSEFKDWLNQ